MRFSPLTSAPTLETERLVLRGFREDDLPAHAAILADPVVMQHFGGHLFGREESWRRLLGGVGLWQLQGACREVDSRLFFHPESERGPARSNRASKALKICATCPVLEQCRRHALAVREPYGIWGGLTEDQRAAIYLHESEAAAPGAASTGTD